MFSMALSVRSNAAIAMMSPLVSRMVGSAWPSGELAKVAVV